MTTPATPAGSSPWPRWFRYPLIALLAAVGVAGLVLATQNSLDSAVVRILIAGVLIPALLMPFQVLGLRRRRDRLAGRVVDQLDALLPRIDSERAAVPADRSTEASESSLDLARTTIATARDRLRTGRTAEAAAALEQLGRLTEGSWSRRSPLTRELADAVATARTLERVDSRTGRGR